MKSVSRRPLDMEQDSDSGLKDPLLKTSREAEEQRLLSRPESSEPVSYLSNASGPQLCYSPLLSCNDDIDSRGETPSSETEASGEEYVVYARRWYILILFSLMAGTQGAVWNTWGPISSTAEEAFGWSDSTIALLSNWGPISYLVAGVFFSWALDVKGEWSCISNEAPSLTSWPGSSSPGEWTAKESDHLLQQKAPIYLTLDVKGERSSISTEGRISWTLDVRG